MTRHLRDTEDGINESGWEQEMSKPILVEDCEKCGRTVTHTTLVEIPAERDQPGYDERWCDACAKVGSFDPDNRDWDAERELREFEGDL